MEDDFDITTKLCHPIMNSDGNENSCNDVILKLPKTEVIKLQSLVISTRVSHKTNLGTLIKHGYAQQ